MNKKIITILLGIVTLFYAGSSSAIVYGGPIQRASNNNKIDQATPELMQANFFAKSALAQDKTYSPNAIQKYGPNVLKDLPIADIQSGFYGESLIDRFLMSEYLFTNLTLHMGISLAQDVDNTVAQTVDPTPLTIDQYPLGLSKGDKPVKLQDLAARAMASTFYARGVTAGNRDVGHRNIDTFYGIIVVNESQYNNSESNSNDWNYPDIRIGSKSGQDSAGRPFMASSSTLNNSVIYHNEDGFVDKWESRPLAKEGTDSRSINFSLIQQGYPVALKNVLIQDEPVSGSWFSVEVTDQMSSSNIPLISQHKNKILKQELYKQSDGYPDIKVSDTPALDKDGMPTYQVTDLGGVAYTQQVIQDKEMEKFFVRGTHFPWAVVIHVRNVPNVDCLDDRATNCRSRSPEFVVAGLARLNPIDFPLYYSGATEGSSDPYLMRNFSTKDLIEAPSKLYMAASNGPLSPKSVSYSLSIGCSGTKPLYNVRKTGSIDSIKQYNFGVAKFDGILSQPFFTKVTQSLDESVQKDFETGTFLGSLKNSINILRYSFITNEILENLPVGQTTVDQNAAKLKKDKLFISLINNGGDKKIKGTSYIPSTDTYVPFINVNVKPMEPVGSGGGSNE